MPQEPKEPAANAEPAPTAAAPATTAEEGLERERIRYGAMLIGAAFVLIAAVVSLALAHFEESGDVTAVIGAVTGVVGTIIGAFFGVQAGSAGKDAVQQSAQSAVQAANEQATLAQAKTEALLGESPPEIIEQVRSKYEHLFGAP